MNIGVAIIFVAILSMIGQAAVMPSIWRRGGAGQAGPHAPGCKSAIASCAVTG